MSIENSNKKLRNDLIGVAGVHFVVSELTLRGLIALPTIRNTAGIDIHVSEQMVAVNKSSSKNVFEKGKFLANFSPRKMP